MDTQTLREKRTQGCGVIAVMCIWMPVTLVFDVIVGYSVFQQCWAYTFAETTGTVISSGVVTSGDSHTLVVLYRYSLNDREYIGGRYCYGMMGVGDGSWRRVQAGLPPGAAVTVYYNPTDPKDATLTHGPHGTHLFLGNFLVPFNMVVLVVVVSWLGRWRDGPWWSAARWGCMSAAVVWGLVAFVSVFAIAFLAGLNPPVWAGMIPWVVGPGLGLAVWAGVGWLVLRAEKPIPVK